MEITRPTLPSKSGYVEVIDEYGEHVYSPTPETKKRLEREKQLDTILGTDDTDPTALEFRKAVQLFATSIDDEVSMMQIASVYPEYKLNTAYQTGDIFRYGTNSVGDPQLYQVLQPHTSAEEWTPDTAKSLYKKIGVSDDGIPIWVQPLGATDAYQIGDIVLYNGKKYESLINANAWSPDAYPDGWKLLDETEPSEPDPEDPEEDIPEWVQPTGTHDAYNTGDIVMYNGKKYESTIDGNTWAPDAYPDGWNLVE